MPRKHLSRLLTFGLAASAAPAFAQIGPATTQPPGAEDPRFGILANDEGYYGASRYSDAYGELLELADDGSMLMKMSGLADEDGIEDADLAEGNERIEFRNPDQARVYLNGRRVSPADLLTGDRLNVRRDEDGNVRRVDALRMGDFEEAPAAGLDRRTPPAVTPRTTRRGPVGRGENPAERPEARDQIPEETAATDDGKGGFADISVEPKSEDGSKPKMQAGDPAGQWSRTPDGDGFEGGGSTYGLGMLLSDSPGPGVMVADVSPDGPAEHAGVQQGDFLMAVNGNEVTAPEDLNEAMTNAPQDKPVTFSVWRDGATEAVKVTPERGARTEVAGSNREAVGRSPRSGYMKEIGAKLRDSEEGGVDVTEAAYIGSLAAEAADNDGSERMQRRRYLYPGDRIVGFNGTPVRNRAWLARQMRNYTGGGYYPLQVVRAGRNLSVPFPVGANIVGNIASQYAF